jgi:5-methylcytosine-specific restriction endonuclease McrA
MTADSPYSRVAGRLVDQGYAAIPIVPGTEHAGSFSRGRWVVDKAWMKYCDERLPTDLEVEYWSKYPDAGVGVALGKASGGLVAVTVDSDRHEVIGSILGVIPEESPVQMGRQGFTGFYRASAAVKSRSFDLNGQRVVDLLASGKAVVIPPTIPDSGRPYAWFTAVTLEHLTIDRLPLLPDDIGARFAAALEPFGYWAGRSYDVAEPRSERPARRQARGQAARAQAYAEYLQSDVWREKRHQALERDEWTCQGCLERPATQVHHLTYDHVGAELLFELVSVCDDCHERAHEERIALEERLIKFEFRKEAA